VTNLIQASTLRSNLAKVLDSVDSKKDYFLVTKKGKPQAALVNLDFFEDLLALSSHKYLNSIKKARKQIKKGLFYSHEEVFGEL
jgi:prevent-host-death family protein